MVRRTIKNFLWAIVVFGIGPAYAESRMAPDHIGLDDIATIELTIPGGQIKIKNIPKVAGLTIAYGGTSSQISFYNGQKTTSVKVEFSVEAKKYGNFTIPPITVISGQKTFKTKTFKLKVSKKPPKQNSPFSIFGNLFKKKLGTRGEAKAQVFFTKPTVFVGEPVSLRYHFGSRYLDKPKMARGKPWPPEFEPSGAFFYTVNDYSPLAGRPTPAPFEYKRIPTVAIYVIPEKPGTLTVKQHVAILSEQGFNSARGADQVAPVSLKVLPLPKQNKPKQFSGNVGQFEIVISKLPAKINQYEELEFFLQINGTGNFINYELPRTNFTGIKLVDQKVVEKKRPQDPTQPVGAKQIRYRATAAKAGVFNPGEIYTNWFDPYTEKYESKTIQLPKLRVKATPPPNIELTSDDFSDSGIFLPAAGFIVLLALGTLAIIRLNPRLLDEAGIKLKTIETPASLARRRDELVYAVCGNKTGLMLERYLRSLGLGKNDMNRLTHLQTHRLKQKVLTDSGPDLAGRLYQLQHKLNKYLQLKKLKDTISFLENLKGRLP